MIIAIILILVAVALFLIFHDDHDDSYTRSENKAARKEPKSSYQKKVTVKPSPLMEPRTVVPEEKQFRPQRMMDVEPKRVSLAFLDRIEYDKTLPELTMSSFIAGIQGHCTEKDLGGIVGLVVVTPGGASIEVHDTDGHLLGYLPMKDRANFFAFNPSGVECPFAGHIDLSITGKFYADIRIVLPSSRAFVTDSLRGFLG